MTEERGLSSISSETSTTIAATVEFPRIVVEEYKEENDEEHVFSSTAHVRDEDEDITITHANPSPTTAIESSQEIYVDEPISHQEENQEEDHTMGSTGNSPSPRSTPSPHFSNHSHELPSAVSSGNGDATEYDELNLNMTAAEMRERISAKKKRDPRKDDRMDILRKYEIIQTL